ncbi:MAG TPA: bifunctional adenosylcobinamide kinase/adenosylcobinamide-phosphate guanylyltransferase [Nitrospirae bacterium]|nr:bifunctional adenosylcobinamide kinase/adenosylcobinamide-phosphate guanylyltransferase [Nitrospirota bacterium]
MGKIVFVTGGRRSGKSAYAQNLAESLKNKPMLYIATCPVIDEETKTRIENHKRDREGAGWDTKEETVDIAGVIREAKGYKTILVECLTLWINNIMFEAGKNGEQVTELTVSKLAQDALAECRKSDSTVIFVSNEVGLGIIPDNRLARNFSDIAGRVNQIIAGEADQAVMMASGLPITLK